MSLTTALTTGRPRVLCALRPLDHYDHADHATTRIRAYKNKFRIKNTLARIYMPWSAWSGWSKGFTGYFAVVNAVVKVIYGVVKAKKEDFS